MRSVALALALLSLATSARAESTTFKIATLAPEGSTWWKILIDADKQLAKESGGRLRFKLYAGGVAGDEPDFVRKMRVGSLHGAAVTSVGLGEIQPALVALQAPGLFKTWDEVDAARDRLSEKLAALLADKGVVVLLWVDVGFNRVFSQAPIEHPKDLQAHKFWVWTQDGVYRSYFDAAAIKPVPLALPDVLPSLQTGLIDAQMSPPLACLSLQWFTKATHMLDWPVGATVGAVVLTEKSLAKLSPEDRALVMKVGESAGAAMRAAARLDNDRAVDALVKSGLRVNVPSAKSRAAWDELAKRAAADAAGKVYPKDLYEELQRAVTEHRASAKK